MPISSPSTALFQLGRGILKIGKWSGTTAPTWPGDYTDIGNCPSFEVEVTEETIDHYSSRTAGNVKDKTVITQSGYTLTFDLDEISMFNMQMYIKASKSNNVLHANQVMDAEYALHFQSDNTTGLNEKWEFWRVKLSPNGSFGVISDDWAKLSFSGEGLADTANHATSPYFDVTFATTTTTV